MTEEDGVELEALNHGITTSLASFLKLLVIPRNEEISRPLCISGAFYVKHTF